MAFTKYLIETVITVCLMMLQPLQVNSQENLFDVQSADVPQFLTEWEDEGSEMCYQLTAAMWTFTTNLTEHNKNKMMELQTLKSKFDRSSWRKATSLKWKPNLEESVSRQLKLLSLKRHFALPDQQFSELQQLIVDMKDIHSKARICPFKGSVSFCEMTLEPDASRILAHSRDYEEQLYIWRSWRDAVGPSLKPRFTRYVELINESSRRIGYSDAGYEERLLYETANFDAELEMLWSNIAPLYKQLHAYVRRQLVQYYGAHRIRPDGPIPAHLLGNMWAQTWKNIIDLVLPFQGKRRVDVTSEMLRQGYTAHRIFQTAEEFFTSMGMKALPVEFWRYSMLTRPVDRPVLCKSSAWDFCNAKDYRIKQCTEVTMDELLVAHHEIAHVQYYLQYSGQPLIFRDGANPGYHEAVSDMILLSVMTPRHLQRIGLLNNVTDDYEANIDYLMEVALDKIPFIPFALVVDQWRWSVFRDGSTDMNQRWWDLRLQYQGITPPITRNENDFDPGSKYHIIADIPYIKYFVSLIIQFQLYESVCATSGHVGPLHTCDIYRSREAGRLLSEVMSFGASQSWHEVLKIATNGKSTKLDVKPMLEYFKPLQQWLEIQNQNEPRIGWTNTKINTAQYEHLERGYASKTNVSWYLFTLVLNLLMIT